jgi:Secretion system C-terminal sorting domain/FG-GAP-like repeat
MSKPSFPQIIRLLIGLLFIHLSISIWAQPSAFQPYQCPVTVDNSLLRNPFAGGLNSPQLNQADLNADGAMDLVIFDRAGNKFITYINNLTGGISAYRHAPQYEAIFPQLRDYAIFRDYNKDGAMDIFCAALRGNDQEIQVFRGFFQDNVLRFEPVIFTYPNCDFCNRKYIYYPDENPGFWNNFGVATSDIPSIDDYDGDGDLDIVAFPSGTGGYLYYLENRSVEKGYGLDSFHYELRDRCWGKIYESGVDNCTAQLSPSPTECAIPLLGPLDERDGVHPGSTLTALDHDQDGDMDLLLGNISFNCLGFVINGGTTEQSWAVAQDTAFPSEDIKVALNDFPAAYYFDISQDGVKDLLVCPNSPTLNDDRSNVWWYQNVSNNDTARFELATRRLLVNDMIDLGSASHPAFADVTGDGLTDLVVGTYGFFTAGSGQTPTYYTNARLYLFTNIGTATAPAFRLTNNDWLGMSEFAPDDYDFHPAFGDLDNDGDLDLLVGSNIGSVYAYFNQAGAGNAMNLVRDQNPMWTQMDIGQVAAPLIGDFDNDGRKDVIMGERFGILNFFKNTGSLTEPVFGPNPALAPNVSNIGNFNVQNDSIANNSGLSTPQLIQNDQGEPMIVVGSSDGYIETYLLGDMTTAPWTLVTKTFGGIHDGWRSSPAFADLDDDGYLEMILGNQSGGLTLYKTILTPFSPPVPVVSPYPPQLQIQITPNPASTQASLLLDGHDGSAFRVDVYDALGRLRLQNHSTGNQYTLPLGDWPAGMYWVRVQTSYGEFGGKMVRE